jgi:hypothetical protein
MAEREIWTDLIVVAPSNPCVLQVALIDEVSDNPLSGAFRNSDFGRHVQEANARVGCNAKKNMPVVCEKCPVVHLVFDYLTSHALQNTKAIS